MPEKVLPTLEQFLRFKSEITKAGFRGLSRQGGDSKKEIGFYFKDKGLTAKVWTKFVDYRGNIRNSDTGWVLITDNSSGEVKYYTHPIHRTVGFMKKLLTYALIAKERIINRPLCEICLKNGRQKYMDIVFGKGLKSRHWHCREHCQSLPWDIGLSAESLKFLRKERRGRRRYREARRKAGLSVGEAMLRHVAALDRWAWADCTPHQF